MFSPVKHGEVKEGRMKGLMESLIEGNDLKGSSGGNQQRQQCNVMPVMAQAVRLGQSDLVVKETILRHATVHVCIHSTSFIL